MIPPTTAEAVNSALVKFDQDLRATPAWSGWEDNRAHRFALKSGERLYPVKQVISMATGVPVSGFSGGDPANKYLSDLGFEVIELERGDAMPVAGSVRQNLSEVLRGYPAARSQPFSGGHPVVQALQQAAAALKDAPALQSRSHLKVVASAGRGNWAKVPWISLLDDRETNTTQRGVYVVFLFRADMRGVYLTFNQGVTEPTSRLGRAGGQEEVREKAQKLREQFRSLQEADFKLDGEVDLAVEAGLGADYEASTIAYKLYDGDALPDDAAILADVGVLLAAYEAYLREPERLGTEAIAAWIFQASPDKWNLRGALQGLTRMRWLVAQHRDKIVPGATVYLWQSGPNAGILGIARVVSGPEELPDLPEEVQYRVDNEHFEGAALRVELEVTAVLSRPILRDELRGHDVLSRLAILDQSIGTNFPVTKAQAEALRLLVQHQGQDPIRLTFLDAAKLVLRERGSPMRVADLWSEIEARGLVPTKGRTPSATLNALLLRSSKGERLTSSLQTRSFYKAGPATFGLLEWLSEDEIKELEEAERIAGGDDIGLQPEAVFDRPLELSKLVKGIADQGFVFEPWQVAAYVTALRTKPFVILAGVSGTGKSKLPGLVAGLTGAKHELLPVRPDWTDSSDVLGYVDLQGAFRPGALLEAVRDASRNQAKHHVCIVDEMNLARVEQYFAEVLSRLEDRQGLAGSATTGPLLVQRLPAESEWAELGLPANFGIVGTVNMDESTHGFSKKVLDRAFTLELSEVDLGQWTAEVAEAPAPRPWPVDAWYPRATRLAQVQLQEDERTVVTEAVRALMQANAILAQAQLQVGYRVRDEVALFLLHAREVSGLFTTRAGRKVDPLDLALQMKVLPRIVGGSASIRATAAQLLVWAVGGTNAATEQEAENITEGWRSGGRPAELADARFPRTAARLALMWDRIAVEGFTSYWL